MHFFFCNRSGSIATGCERELPRIIEGAAVDAGANWNSGDHLSGLRVEHRHQFVVTSREQTMMSRIKGDAARFFSRCKRPVREYVMFAGVDDRDLALIFDVAVDSLCFFIYCREFGSSFKLDRR